MKISIKLHKKSIRRRISNEQTEPQIIKLYFWEIAKTLKHKLYVQGTNSQILSPERKIYWKISLPVS